jgi:hypothetical protein
MCEMNSGEGNGKPLLDSNSCLKNPLLDLQASEQTRITTTTTAQHSALRQAALCVHHEHLYF